MDNEVTTLQQQKVDNKGITLSFDTFHRGTGG